MVIEEKRLIMVTSVNNNKFYNMKRLGTGSFEVAYGRVDKTCVTRTYPMSMWDKKYNEKIRKGYKDVTNLYMEDNTPVTTTVDVASNDTTGLLRRLQRFATGSIRRNYSVTSEKVTQAQIDKAQDFLNILSGLVTQNAFVAYDVNNYLLELYHAVPRLMANVRDHLLEPQGFIDVSRAKQLVVTEQANIDVMAQQVRTHIPSAGNAVEINIEVHEATGKDVDLVRSEAEEESHRIRRVYQVINLETQANFDHDLAEALASSSERGKLKLLWHGSRNANWLSILDTGLLIRPTGVLTTGSMFGDGIYFAPRFRKSMGYTSLRGSYWADGRDDVAYMALFHVRVGKQLRMTRHDSSCYSFNRGYLDRKGGYDSVYAARKGGFLLNDENIVYAPAQCTVAYLVEIS
jgi:poly [ADP-ribose] polymerase